MQSFPSRFSSSSNSIFIIAKSVQNLYGADRHGAHYVVRSKRVMR
jgi:hypothetical protein